MGTKTSAKPGNGVLPIQQLKQAVRDGFIKSSVPLKPGQFQPSSVDLRLGAKAYRIRSSFLPQRVKISKMLKELKMYEIDLTGGAILEKGNVYLVPLMESLNLPKELHGRANPKSSTGRLDIFTRVISDYSHRFEDIAHGYRGGLYLEVVPRSFTIKVKTGLCLNQMRLFRGESTMPDDELKDLHEKRALIYCGSKKQKKPVVKDGLYLSIEIHAGRKGSVVGFMAKKNSAVIDLECIGKYAVHDFWDPIKSPRNNYIILEPEEFYIFASKEKVRVPIDCAAEMVEFDAGSGELRTHYAGFFDSGFGDGSVLGTKAVLEVRPHDVPFRVEDGQLFFKLRFEKMAQQPLVGYGKNLGSNYYKQGLALSKHFALGKNGYSVE